VGIDFKSRNILLQKSVDLILEFGEALHNYGATSYKLEQALQNISKKLGMEGEFFSTPTLLISSLKNDHEIKTYVKRVYSSDLDLRKLTLLDSLGDKLIDGEIDIEEAYRKLKIIRNLKDPYSGLIEIIAYGLIGVCASVFFNGNLPELIASGLVGSVVGFITVFANRISGLKNITEFVAAFFATILAVLASKYIETYNFNLVILPSLIVLIPGLTLTIAITELATYNLASGTARLMQAILVFFKLSFGVALALQFLNFLSVDISFINSPIELSLLWKSISLFFASIAFTILFKIPLRFYPWVLLVSAVGFFTTYFASIKFGVNMGTFLAGFAVCIVANAFGRWKKAPTILLELPGLITIVPGSIGFKGLQFFFEKNTLAGIDSIFDMFLIAIALVSGFLLANIMLVSNRSL
jgi:uncharacterized membrane protein YjjP (DUF1212 family)